MTAHLIKAEKDIEKAIPNASFNGLAILDFEYWRPQYKLNWSSKRIYRNESDRIVRERTNSTLNETEVKRIAAEEFDKAAYKFMVETIQLAIKLRPGGKWGFYGLPYCNYNAGKGGEYNCSEEFQGYNDGILNILNETTALYPSIYLLNLTDTDLNFRYVHAILNETNRVLAMLNYSIPAYPYSGFEYLPKTDPLKYYSDDDLCNEVKQQADFGMQGTIVWSTSKNMTFRCPYIANYINTTYGPYVSRIESEFRNCSMRKCGGQGRCVLKTPQVQCNSTFNEADYECFPPSSTITTLP
ncbi:Hyaluronidase-4 [Toxocara canis]|uniref:Hyaluronidase n=1 Tax=Toxocara canis TaxID=6265 RepID=A0A0B2VJ59_TOXCA|nr:Hyaluronidase-4 [Toxocara canis]